MSFISSDPQVTLHSSYWIHNQTLRNWGGGLIQDTQPSFPELWGLGFNPGYTTIPSGALILDTQPSFPELEGGRVILIHNKPLQS